MFVGERGFESSTTSQLFLMNFDGSNLRQLTSDTSIQHRVPCWSPDGTQIAFGGSTENFETTGEIFILNLGDNSVRRLTIAGNNPSWGRNNKIVFDAFNPQAVSSGVQAAWKRPAAQRRDNRLQPNFVISGGGDIYVINPDGSGLQRLTQIGVAQQPAWSPDASRIVFSRVSRFGLSDDGVFIMNIDGSGQTRLIDYAHSPVFSPDGQQIAFDRGQIQKINIDGSGFAILTNPDGQNISDEDPDWR